MCWGGDLLRDATGTNWLIRDFSGTRWQLRRTPEAIAYRINTYRVLLTRARYETIIWVPRGDPEDRTRDPHEMDAIADYLRACGVRDLRPEATASPTARQPLLV
jgi:hypothetical protein